MDFQDLPLDIIYNIFSYFSFRERNPLKLCSKSIRNAAINAPLYIEEVVFKEFYSAEKENVQIKICFEKERIVLSNQENGTCINKWNEDSSNDQVTVIDNSNFYETAAKILRDIIIRNNVICGTFDINFRMIGDFLLESDRINTERFRLFNGLEEKRDEFLNTEDRDAAGFWLKHANPHYLKSFTVYMDDAECSLASSGENLRYAETVHILRKSDIDDRILNQLTALDIELESSRITFKGINHLIKKWIDQNVPLGSRFVYYNDNMENFSLDKLILNNHLPVESSNNKAIFLLASNKVLHVWVDNSSVYVECMKRK